MTEAIDIPAFGVSWGHANGLIDLRRAAPVTDVQGLIDRQAIVETIQTYGLAIDEQRWDVLADVLAEDHVYRGAVAGTAALDALDSRDELIGWLQNYMGTLDAQLRHNFTNVVVIEQGEQEATALAYVVLASTSPTEGARVASTAFYRVSLRREDGVWRIARLYTGFDTAF